MSNRIPQTFIDDLLARTDIIEIIGSRIKLIKRGNNHHGLCPFHDEKTPSFTVSQDKQFYYCFGCGAHGNVIGFLLNYDKMEFVDAIKHLATKAGLDIPVQATHEQHIDPEMYEAMQQASQYFQLQLRQHQVAINYLKSRGVSGKTAKNFGIGYALEDWDGLTKYFKQQNDTLNKLIINGLIIKKDTNKMYDRFRHRIIFPIRDIRGRVVAFGGRCIEDERPKYLNSPETPIFHKSNELYGLYEARQHNSTLEQILIVEGYMDVVSLAQHGIHYAVATLGTATNRKHIQKLLRYSAKLIFCFDGDNAGHQAAWKALLVALPLLRDGVAIRFLFLKAGEDPDSMISKIGKTQFENILCNAYTLEKVFFTKLQRNSSIETIDGRAKFAKQATELISTMPAGIYQKLMLEQAAKILKVSVADLANLQPQYKTTQAHATEHKTPPSSPSRSTQPSVAEVAISLLLQKPSLAQLVVDDMDILKKLNREDTQLLIDLTQFCLQRPDCNTGSLLEHCQLPKQQQMIALLSANALDIDEDAVIDEFKNLLWRLKQQSYDKLARQLIQKAKQQTLTEDEKQLLLHLLEKKTIKELD